MLDNIWIMVFMGTRLGCEISVWCKEKFCAVLLTSKSAKSKTYVVTSSSERTTKKQSAAPRERSEERGGQHAPDPVCELFLTPRGDRTQQVQSRLSLERAFQDIQHP